MSKPPIHRWSGWGEMLCWEIFLAGLSARQGCAAAQAACKYFCGAKILKWAGFACPFELYMGSPENQRFCGEAIQSMSKPPIHRWSGWGEMLCWGEVPSRIVQSDAMKNSHRDPAERSRREAEEQGSGRRFPRKGKADFAATQSAAYKLPTKMHPPGQSPGGCITVKQRSCGVDHLLSTEHI